MAVVSISRQYGAGGRVVGEMVARRLGYKLLEREIINAVAQQSGVPASYVQEVEKSVGDHLARIISEWVSTNPLLRNLPDPTAEFDEDKYRDSVRQIILTAAKQGNVVFVGRGSQYILADDPRTVRIMLVAREEDRIDFLMRHFSLDRERAETVVRKEEKKRLAFLRGFGGLEPDDPMLYHLIINTSLVTPEKAADFICRLAMSQDYAGA